LINSLRKAEIFWGLEVEDIEILAESLPTISLPGGEVLFKQGTIGDSMAVVVQGRLQIRVSDEGGQVTTVGMLGPGESVGEMACVDPGPRSATVVASQDSVVCELDAETVETLAEVAPFIVGTIVGGVMRHVTKRLRQTNERLELELRGMHRDRDPASIRHLSGSDQPKTGRGLPCRGMFDFSDSPLPVGLQRGDLRMLGSAGMVLTYADGVPLCSEGRVGASCFVLLRGHVDVSKASVGGARHLATLGPGSIVGQMALVDGSPRAATVRAKGELVALEVGRDVFERLVKAGTPLGLRFQRQIALAGIRQLRLANVRLRGLLGKGGHMDRDGEEGEERDQAKLRQVQTSLYEWEISVDE